jgi:hypothetical protein
MKTITALSQILWQLDPEGLRDVLQYARVLANAHEADIPAPTPEEWARVPGLVRLKIFFIVWLAVQHVRLQKLFCE